jgi:hypothetical protein
MKIRKKLTAAACLLVAASLQQQTLAAITISNFEITSNSLTFHVSGTFPNTLPAAQADRLYFVNGFNPGAFPGFVQEQVGGILTSNFTGSAPTLPSTYIPIGLGNSAIGDFFVIDFYSDFSAGQTISGTLTASWTTQPFIPAAAPTIDVFWGIGSSSLTAIYPDLINSAPLLTSISIPEPNSCILSFFSLLLASIRRRKVEQAAS